MEGCAVTPIAIIFIVFLMLCMIALTVIIMLCEHKAVTIFGALTCVTAMVAVIVIANIEVARYAQL